MPDLSYNDALAEAGSIAAMMLEVKDPAELAIIERCLPVGIVALAILMVEEDAGFAERWLAAGTDWGARGAILHEAIFFLLRPEEHTL